MDIHRARQHSMTLAKILDRLLGSKQAVKARREVVQVIEYLNAYCAEENEYEPIGSGSRAEGFDMSGSDYDFMFSEPHVNTVLILLRLRMFRHTSG